MKQPHVHHKLIYAWADGEKIQYSVDGGESWEDCHGTPQWNPNVLYRLAPITIKYRKYLFNNGHGDIRVGIHNFEGGKSPEEREQELFFVGWIDTKWEEVNANRVN